jgi:hypothetical protein
LCRRLRLFKHLGERNADTGRIEPQLALVQDDWRRYPRPFAPVVDQLAGLPIGDDVILDGGDLEIAGQFNPPAKPPATLERLTAVQHLPE